MTHWIWAARRPVMGVAAMLLLGLNSAYAQLDLGALSPTGQAAGGNSAAPVTLEARIAPAAGGRPPQLVVTADVATGWHIYSLTQKRGGPVPSKITIDSGSGYKLAGEFAPSTPPDAHPEPAFDNLPVETHEGQIVWTAPLELSPDVDLAKLSITGKFSYQACDADSCLPPKTLPFSAALGAPVAPPQNAPRAAAGGQPGVYKPSTAHVVLHGYVEPKVVAPGEQAQLVIVAEPSEGWHIYALAPRDPQKISKPTLISLVETAGLLAGTPTQQGTLVEHPSPAIPGETDRYFERPVTWTIPLTVSREAQPGELKIAGLIGFQTCQKEQCDLPQGAQFNAVLSVATPGVQGRVPLTFSPAKSYKQVADGSASGASKSDVAVGAGGLNLKDIRPEGPRPSEESLPKMIVFGFLGGLILNLMPCVLPVIGLKILSFVEQSGKQRGQIFVLNVWYSAGILAVFMILATLPVAFHYFQNKQFGWGQQFAYDGFNITLTAIVFVMALSFLGVWEIPIPGFVGGRTANELAAKEGAAGAFFKGALTTVLATPCSGPFLTSALAFAVAEPPHITYALFACIGLGMAFPYLAIGAFPQLIRFLPRPGAWMDTFKQMMGFVLLGTVVYLMTIIASSAAVPTLTLLMGLWAACWWIGRTPAYAEFGAKAKAWLGGIAVATVVGLIAFQGLGPIMMERYELAITREVEKQIRTSAPSAEIVAAHKKSHGKFELPWETFSIAKLQELTAAGKTVMLDFTADWCPTCQTLKKLVLDTAGIQEVVKTNGIVPLIVDMTRFPPEEAELLQTLSGGQSIPVLAIFPAGRPNNPIVLAETYTQRLLLEKLREAGPSQETADRTALNKR